MKLSQFFFLLITCAAFSPGRSGQAAETFPTYAAADTGAYDVTFYFLDLNVSDSSTFLKGSVAIWLKVKEENLSHVVLDMSDLLLTDSVLVNGITATYTHVSNKLDVRLNSSYTAADPVKVEVFYHGLGKNAGAVRGIYSKYNVTWDQRVTWTLSEPFSAFMWFPCKQSLTDKADSVYVNLSTDNTRKAGSNGLLTASIVLPGNRIRYEWKSRYPIDYYLISFAVSNYRDYSFYAKNETSDDSILIQNYIYQDEDYLIQNKASIDKTANLINLYAGLFGKYPFSDEKYGHCIAPSGGGMEHQTMTTLVNFSYLLVAHELAHQWFGDFVTCSDWKDIWINEGFASYSEYLAYQFLNSQTDADNWMARTHDLVKSEPGGSIYIPEEDADNEDRIFDYRLTYAKGAAIIHMMRQEIADDDLFFAILREFLNRYGNGTASGEDFKNLLIEMTGKDFTEFFNQWYYGEGYPTHTVTWMQLQDTLYIHSLQTVSSTTQLFNVQVEYKITVNGKDTMITRRQTTGYDTWKVFMQGEVTAVQTDPNRWLILQIAGTSRIGKNSLHSRYTLVPNPARDKISISFTDPVEQYHLYLADASGRILYSEQSSSSHKVIDVNRFPKGMYFLIVEENNALYPVKFVKN